MPVEVSAPAVLRPDVEDAPLVESLARPVLTQVSCGPGARRGDIRAGRPGRVSGADRQHRCLQQRAQVSCHSRRHRSTHPVQSWLPPTFEESPAPSGRDSIPEAGSS